MRGIPSMGQGGSVSWSQSLSMSVSVSAYWEEIFYSGQIFKFLLWSFSNDATWKVSVPELRKSEVNLSLFLSGTTSWKCLGSVEVILHIFWTYYHLLMIVITRWSLQSWNKSPLGRRLGSPIVVCYDRTQIVTDPKTKDFCRVHRCEVDSDLNRQEGEKWDSTRRLLPSQFQCVTPNLTNHCTPLPVAACCLLRVFNF